MKKTILVFLLFIFLGAAMMAQPKTIRVATFNMGQLSMGKEEHTAIMFEERSKKHEVFKRLFSIVNADIFCFCEFPDYFSLLEDSTVNYADKTKSLLSEYNYFIQGAKVGKRCNVIASKSIPLTEQKSVHFTINNKKSRIYYLQAKIDIDNKSVKLIDVHLDVPKYKENRDKEIRELIDTFKYDEYVIICGDFNVAKTSEYDAFRGTGYVLANHGEYGDIITHPWKNGGGTCIDNIICKGFDIEMVQTYNANLSDHVAISCDLIIKK